MALKSANTAPKDYNYYAFISYSRKDLKWAKWLQKKLETYRLPSKLRKNNDEIPKRIVPVFRDQTDLSGVVLEDSLKKELDASKYLIVICSANSSDSEWVNKEIEYFKSIGRTDKIIPIMLDSSMDCIPDEILNITPAVLGINVKESGKRHAFLQVVSTLLNLRFDDLKRRDKRRRVRNNIILSILLTIVISIITFIICYNIPYTDYYNDITFNHELPIGVYKLTKEQAEKNSCCYKFTTQRGKVISVEKVNPYGKLTDSPVYLATTQYSRQLFSYDEDGELISVSYSNKNGEIVYEKKLSYDMTGDEMSVEYIKPLNNTKALGLLSDISYLNVPFETAGKSEITRQLNTYDADGYLKTTVFHRDNLETPSCDSNGVYGKSYEYNENGQISLITNLDINGEAFNCRYGWAKVAYEYDEYGNCILEQYLDKDDNKIRINTGVSALKISYDENFNIANFEYLDEEGLSCTDKNGISEFSCKYETPGLMSSYVYLDTDDNEINDQYGINQTLIEYDSNGYQTKISFRDIKDEPVFSPEYGCYQYAMKPDAQGRIVEASFCDIDGNLMADEASGASINCFTYDENGYLNEMYYLDEDRQPVLTTSGYSSFVITRNSLGQILKEETYDTESSLICTTEGYAVIEYEYDAFGNITKASYFDENEKPCKNSSGYSIVKYEYEQSNPVTIYYYDENEEPTLCSDNYHMSYMIYENGKLLHTSYYDTNITLSNNSSGYAIHEQDYDSLGNVVADAWYDENSEPLAPPRYYLIKYVYDAIGNKTLTRCFTTESSKAVFTVGAIYDSFGNIIMTLYYDQDGNRIGVSS